MHLVKFILSAALFFVCANGSAQDTLLPSSFSHIDDRVMLYPKGFATPGNTWYPSDTLATRYFLARSPFSILGTDSAGKLSLDAFPVLEARAGYDSYSGRILKESFAGAGINLRWKNTFHLFGFLGQGQVLLPSYADSVSRQWGIVPGASVAHALGDGSMWYNHAKLIASCRLHPYVSVEGGYGKNFFGNGIRSLFLGDGASPYPFARINTTIGKITYTNLYCNFYDIRGSMGERSRFINKYASMHYLTWNLSKRFQLNFFEAIVFPNRNQNGSGHFFEPNYLNPVIFLRPVEYSVGSPDNSLLGAGFQLKLKNGIGVYGQVILDEFLLSKVREGKGWVENKQGIQAGAKMQEPFHIKYLDVQAEINWVRPYTYYHKNSLQNYAHMNQPLAHPLGANFSELLMRINYARYKNLRLSATLMYAEIGYDKDGLSYGQNVYQPYYLRPLETGNRVGQGLFTRLMLADAALNWIPEEASGSCFFVSCTLRGSVNERGSQWSVIPMLGLRSRFLPGTRYF
jgi:hypothetical protein